MKKLTCVLLAAVLLCGLAACGGNGSPSEAQSPSAPSGSSSAASEAPPQSSEAEEVIALNQAFLTGEAKDEDYPEGKRITAVMVNNISQSRPTRGVSEAQVVFEIQVEEPITRLMCLYEDYETMPVVGSVRSARDQFFQLLLPLRGFYVHQGHGFGTGSPTGWLMRDYEYGELDLDLNEYTGDSFRMNRPGMASEYTLYTDAEHITKAIADKGADDYRSYTEPIFNFVPYNQDPYVPAEGTADEVAVLFNQSYRTLFEYNSATGKYEMSMFHSYGANAGQVLEYIDENNNQQVAFDNVVVLFAPMENHPGTPLKKVDYSVGGGGYLFTQGGYEVVIWRKGPANYKLSLHKPDGYETPAQLNVGTTYVAIVNDNQLGNFDEILRSGDGGQAVGEGQVNSSETEHEDD